MELEEVKEELDPFRHRYLSRVEDGSRKRIEGFPARMAYISLDAIISFPVLINFDRVAERAFAYIERVNESYLLIARPRVLCHVPFF
jgi:hypothetical protein